MTRLQQTQHASRMGFSLGDLHESLLDELCRSRHGIRIDLDAGEQRVPPVMSPCGRPTQLDARRARRASADRN